MLVPSPAHAIVAILTPRAQELAPTSTNALRMHTIVIIWLPVQIPLVLSLALADLD